MISHDLGVIAEIADIVNVMYAGSIVEEADVYTLFESPKHPYTLGLLKSVPKLSSIRENGELYVMKGIVPDSAEFPSGCRFHPRCLQMMPGKCDCEFPGMFEIGENHRVRCFLYEQT